MTIDLANLTNKTSLSGTEQILLNDGGTAKDVTVDVLMAGVVKSVTDPVTGGITKIWTGTQAAYDALTPADDTLYIIVEA